MATGPIQVRDGAVSLPSGFAADFQDFTISESQATEDTSQFGANLYGRNTGTGTPMQVITVNGFAKKGGGATDTPGFGKMAATNGDLGAAATFTIATAPISGVAVNMTGSYIIRNLTMRLSRIRAAAPVSFELVNAGDITTTWA